LDLDTVEQQTQKTRLTKRHTKSSGRINHWFKKVETCTRWGRPCSGKNSCLLMRGKKKPTLSIKIGGGNARERKKLSLFSEPAGDRQYRRRDPKSVKNFTTGGRTEHFVCFAWGDHIEIKSLRKRSLAKERKIEGRGANLPDGNRKQSTVTRMVLNSPCPRKKGRKKKRDGNKKPQKSSVKLKKKPKK